MEPPMIRGCCFFFLNHLQVLQVSVADCIPDSCVMCFIGRLPSHDHCVDFPCQHAHKSLAAGWPEDGSLTVTVGDSWSYAHFGWLRYTPPKKNLVEFAKNTWFVASSLMVLG